MPDDENPPANSAERSGKVPEHSGRVPERSSRVTLIVAPALQPLMYSRRRGSRVELPDEVSTVGHLIGSVGIPLTEIGDIVVGGRAVEPAWRPLAGSTVEVSARPRPQPAPTHPPRFVLDVHLGTLARRLRLLGVDAAWRNDATDAELVAQAADEQRVILTRDHGLLLRRAVHDGAYVRGNDPDDQLHDTLDRFAPPLMPWTRCPACNALLEAVEKSKIVDRIQPGTKRNYDDFAQCRACARVYWQGAHRDHLQRIVATAEALDSSRPTSSPQESRRHTRR
jgi:uncharacterized protein